MANANGQRQQKTGLNRVAPSKQSRDKRKEELIEYMDTLPLKPRAQAIAIMLIKEARQTLGEEAAKNIEAEFKSPEFMTRLMQIMSESGTQGLIEELAKLDPNDTAAGYEFLTGEEWVAPGAKPASDDYLDDDDYLHVDIDA